MVTEPHDDALARFRAQDLDAAMADAGRRQGVVTPMFDVIAPRYDDFTRLFSFGMDASWKRDLVRAVVAAAPRNASRGLDLACGTGDIAFALSRAKPALWVTGVDPATRMLEIAQSRTNPSDGRVDFELGEMAALPADTGMVDVITAGYGFRNVPDVEAAVRECARVLRPGGVLGSLDFFRPPNPLWRALFLGYLRVSGDLVGWLWHRTPSIYGYIARSISGFKTADEFAAILARNGFRVVERRSRLFGGIAMHVAVRESGR